LGYGFVKFANEIDARTAMENLDGKMIENKTLRVNIAKNGKMQKTNLYIAYLSNQITDKFILKSCFEKFGKITDTKLLTDERGASKGVGFVKFESIEDAEKAIQELDGSMDPNVSNGSHPLIVKFSDKDKKKDMRGNNMKNNQYNRSPFNKNLPMFQGYRYNPYGNAYDRAPNPYQNPYPNQYNNMPNNNNNNFQQDYNQPNFYQPQQQMPPQNQQYNNVPNIPKSNYNAPMMPNGPDSQYCVFAYNLPPESDDNLVFRLFSPYGNISSVKVMKDPNTGQCRGFAFVNFFKQDEAFASINALNGYRYNNKVLQVSWKKQNN